MGKRLIRCVACGGPADRLDADGMPLCRLDWRHLCERWRREGGPVNISQLDESAPKAQPIKQSVLERFRQ